MDGTDMGVMMMMVMVVVGALIVLAAIGAVYVALRATRQSPELDESARELLDRRLASGEIEPEEYYERDAALRDAEPSGRRRRGILSRS